MTNKKFKLAAMSLATAVAVSAVGPSASAVTLTRMTLAARIVIRVRTAVRSTAPTSTRMKRIMV